MQPHRHRDREHHERVVPRDCFIGVADSEIEAVDRRAVGRATEVFQVVADRVEPQIRPQDEEDDIGRYTPDEQRHDRLRSPTPQCPSDDGERNEDRLNLRQQREAHHNASQQRDATRWRRGAIPPMSDRQHSGSTRQVRDRFQRRDVSVPVQTWHQDEGEAREQSLPFRTRITSERGT